jgi:hypothetical protein
LPVEPILESTASGHGIGKSALVAWIVDFIMSTRPFCKGIVTANTFSQLETKTWAEIAKWTKMCITGHWFRVTSGKGAMRVAHNDWPEQWRCDGMAWRENAPEAFAGLHAANSTPFYIFDEASSIPQKIFETAMGGLTDGEPMQFLFGNPTQNAGYFFDTHHKLKHRWRTRAIDSRNVEITNKKYLNQLIEDYGLDSDLVKVRVLGQFPSLGTHQLIPKESVDRALANEALSLITDANVWGLDFARYGMNKSILCRRKGRDGRSWKWDKWAGASPIQVAKEVSVMARAEEPDAIFADDSGIGGPAIDFMKQELHMENVIPINFGWKSMDKNTGNMGTYAWVKMGLWLPKGAIPDDRNLTEQLVQREYTFDRKQKQVLVPKEVMEREGKESPDEGDALALTFPYPAQARAVGRYTDNNDKFENYDPIARERFYEEVLF